jgi:hypothetical protein
MYEAGCPVEKIAAGLTLSTNTVRKMLAEWYTANGEIRPDGRSRRPRSCLLLAIAFLRSLGRAHCDGFPF